MENGVYVPALRGNVKSISIEAKKKLQIGRQLMSNIQNKSNKSVIFLLAQQLHLHLNN